MVLSAPSPAAPAHAPRTRRAVAKETVSVQFFGIRHHGPGSARRLVQALDALQPTQVLIEGPADATDSLQWLTDPAMVLPVALLSYVADDPSRASFYPWAVYSPEYQAILWAFRHQREVRFIDLPTSLRLGLRQGEAFKEPAEETGAGDDEGETEDEKIRGDETAIQGLDQDQPTLSPLSLDPVGALAAAAGYEDGESWWNDVIEAHPAPGPVFDAVAEAMTALREACSPSIKDRLEEMREAHMRLEIAKALKEVKAEQASGALAVVCGAWHVPALRAKISAQQDRACLKGLKKVKTLATWVPWTSERLSQASGYGAGVRFPDWYDHLWHVWQDQDQLEKQGKEQEQGQAATLWLVRFARSLRQAGHVASPASVIEAWRLTMALTALRERSAPGYEEIRDAAIACLCGGSETLWHESPSLCQIGQIPDNMPQAPLLADLQQQQKKAKLKAQADETLLSLDLRSEMGMKRSILLHRLTLLTVPWGQLQDPGGSRGTFRERWTLCWQPEFSVQLIEQTTYGSTLETAAENLCRAQMEDSPNPGDLAIQLRSAMVAHLEGAVKDGLALLEQRATDSSDGFQLLRVLPPLADVLRYGQARVVSIAHLEGLFHRLVVHAALALPQAARDLDDQAASDLKQALKLADGAVRLLAEGGTSGGGQAAMAEQEAPEATGVSGPLTVPAAAPDEETLVSGQNPWDQALHALLHHNRSTPMLAGLAARLLYEADLIPAGEMGLLLSQKLSPGTDPSQAAGFFEGFFEGAGQRLIHDDALRRAVDRWLLSLTEESFIAHLPLFRRVFAALDASERRYLLEALIGKTRKQGEAHLAPVTELTPLWEAHQDHIMAIMNRGQA